MALGQSHDCPSANEVTLKDMGNINWHQTITKHNKAQAMHIINGLYLSLILRSVETQRQYIIMLYELGITVGEQCELKPLNSQVWTLS